MSDTDLSPVRPTCTFTATDSLRFRHQFFDALEELRVRRAMDTENEERIKQLIHEKYQLQTKLDEAEKKRKEAVARQEERVSNVKHQQQNLIQELQQEKTKLSASCETIEKEQKTLKDEIRNLEMCKYILEKKVKEQEKKLEMQAVSGGVSESQLIEVEGLAAKMKRRLGDLTRHVDRLEKNVVESEKMNSKLWTLCDQQKNEIRQHKQETNKLNTELLQIRVKADQLPCKMLDQLSAIQQEKDVLSTTLRTKDDIINRLKNQLTDSSQLTQSKVDALRDAHKLLERHISSKTKVQSELTVCQKQLDDQLEKYEALKVKFNDMCKQRDVDLQTHRNTQDEWQKQMDGLGRDIEKLKEEKAQQKKSLTELEDLNTSWAERNLQLTRDINELKCEREKPTRDAEIQTQIETMETDVQTQPNDVTHKDVQVTMETDVRDSSTETIATDSRDVSSQTDLLLLPQIDRASSSSCSEKTTDHPSTTTGSTTGSFPVQPGDISPELLPSSETETTCPPGGGEQRSTEVLTPGVKSCTDTTVAPQESAVKRSEPTNPGAAETRSVLGVTESTIATDSRPSTQAPLISLPFDTYKQRAEDELSPNRRFLFRMKSICADSNNIISTENQRQHTSEEKADFTTDLRSRLRRSSSPTTMNRLTRHSFLNFPEPITPSNNTAVSMATSVTMTTSNNNVTSKPSNGSQTSLTSSLSGSLATNRVTMETTSSYLSVSNSSSSSLATSNSIVTMATSDALGVTTSDEQSGGGANSKRPGGILYYPTSSRSSKRRKKSVTFSDERHDVTQPQQDTTQPESPVSIIPETPNL